MPYTKFYIDDRLVEWGDQLFEPPLKKARHPKEDRPLWLMGYLTWSAIEHSRRSALIREQIARTVHRAPEVMVKITSKKSAGCGMVAIANHLDYISRNGKLELESDQGELLLGKGDLKAYLADWQRGSNGSSISEEGNPKKRDATNIMFSMPAGTPAKEVKDAVRSVLEEEIGGKFSYVFALHQDTDHSHVHVCINRHPITKGPLFALRKKDLTRWRERFAVHLRERGIEANSTPRRTRGVAKDPISQELFHLRKSGRAHQIPKRPIAVAAEGLFERELQAWRNMAAMLNASDSKPDQALAKYVETFADGVFRGERRSLRDDSKIATTAKTTPETPKTPPKPRR